MKTSIKSIFFILISPVFFLAVGYFVFWVIMLHPFYLDNRLLLSTESIEIKSDSYARRIKNPETILKIVTNLEFWALDQVSFSAGTAKYVLLFKTTNGNHEMVLNNCTDAEMAFANIEHIYSVTLEPYVCTMLTDDKVVFGKSLEAE